MTTTALALAACSGSKGDTGALPSESPSTSTSPPSSPPSPPTTVSPSATGPGGVPIPTPGSAAAEHSAAGAKAFAEYYTRLLDYTYATRDVQPLRQASDPSCVLCGAVANDIAKYAKPGYKWSGGRITLKDVSIAQPTPTQAVATANVSITALTVIDPNGKRDKESGPAYPRAQLRIVENWTGNRWTPVDLLIGT